MKKMIIGLLALVVSTSIVKAQSSNVLSAWEYMSVYESERKNGNTAVAIENLLRAKESIDAAAVNEKTMFQSKTWKRRADVYLRIVVDNDPALAQFKSTALEEMYKSVLKAQTVEINEKTGKPKLAEEQELMSRTAFLADTLMDVGGAYYNSGDYKTAYTTFEKSFGLLKNIGILDTAIYRNLFLTSYLAEDYDNALRIGNELISWNYNNASVYGTVAQIYVKKGDSEKGLQIIKDARKKFPARTEFITEELNYYLGKSDNANAARVLDEAIAAYKNDNEMLKQLYFNSGVIYSNLLDTIKSREYYSKALEVDPEYFSAMNNLASSYLAEANAIVSKANRLPINEQAKYNTLIAKANEIYKKAANLLEKAYDKKLAELNASSDPEVKQKLGQETNTLKDILYEIFYKLNDEKADKYR